MASAGDLVAAAVAAAKANDADALRGILEQYLSTHRPPSPPATPKPPMREMQPALEAALERSNVEAAHELLARGCGMYSNAVSAAHKSCCAETDFNLASFECMLAHGWDINHSMDHMGDALIMAISLDKPPLSRWLLEHGADPNLNAISTQFGRALEVACRHGAPLDVIRLLLKSGAEVSDGGALVAAATGGRVDALKVLIDEGGAKIDAIPSGLRFSQHKVQEADDWGTALHRAAATGHAQCVEFLLSRGARKDIRNGVGRTPKETAEKFGHDECARLLA